MKHDIINNLSPFEATLAKWQRIFPGVGATVILLLLTVTCKDQGVTEAAFPLFFLPLISVTSFIMAGNRAASLVLKPVPGSTLVLSRKIATAGTAEYIPFMSYFSSWALSWMSFTLGVIMAVAIGGLAGTVMELVLPGRKIPALSVAAFLQIPSLAGFALIRHPFLLLLPNQGPLLAGVTWIALGTWTAARILKGTPSKDKNPQNRRSTKKARTPSHP